MKSFHQSLINWYQENRRILPWRQNKDPYRIWISEVMLQQTTVVTVIPYYENFLKSFPDIKALAKAPLEKVLTHWSGLGYYSRARNLHKAAQILNSMSDFPKTFQELIKLPGFGPYTSRAVSSIAFNQPVGVLDGNVIRVLTRFHALASKWWLPNEKQKLQALADELAQFGNAETYNQAIMELGATICTPHNPHCILCPVQKNCNSFKAGKQNNFPTKKPRKKSEVWIWQPLLLNKSNKWAFVKNDYAPFLKGSWIFPGSIRVSKEKPKIFQLNHKITHHDIYIQIKKTDLTKLEKGSIKWFTKDQIKTKNPSSLLQKVLSHSQF
jgi:A/G-specific adenine glycosylase